MVSIEIILNLTFLLCLSDCFQILFMSSDLTKLSCLTRNVNFNYAQFLVLKYVLKECFDGHKLRICHNNNKKALIEHETIAFHSNNKLITIKSHNSIESADRMRLCNAQ